MKSVKHPNGYVGIWDDELIPGDLITAYHSGYHEFIKYEYRGHELVPLIHYKKRFNLDGKPIKSKVTLVCDGAYCRKANEHIEKSISDKKIAIENLSKLLN